MENALTPDEERIADMITMQMDEIAAKLGFTPDPVTLRYSEEEGEAIIEYCRAYISRHPS
jgi:hypothetical protein